MTREQESKEGSESFVCQLAIFRQRAEEEAETACHEIATSLGLALLDICRVFCFDEGEIRLVIGDPAYRAIGNRAMPFKLTQEVERVRQAEVP